MSAMNEVTIPVLEVKQPIGTFYVGVMSAKQLFKVAHADIRNIESDNDRYVGIQRKLSQDRVKDIALFCKSIDATFPTSIVLSLDGACAATNEQGQLTIREGQDPDTGEKIPLGKAASILDGQHRVEGLRAAGSDLEDFQVPVSIFINPDKADQAYIFSTVNLAQTKVNKSLVYDLLDYSKARSPQKTAHDLAVAFDKFEESPFCGTIKRLGSATPGRTGETLAQATVVNGILPLISKRPDDDRFAMAKGDGAKVEDSSYQDTPLRSLWVNNKDGEIAKILLEYFKAVKEKWPDAWLSREGGEMLPRTNGFRAFMRLFKNIYLKEKPLLDMGNPILASSVYKNYLDTSALKDSDFNTANFAPGSSGETKLYNDLRNELGV